MRIRSVLALLAVFVLQACGVGGLFRTYEYEEEMYLSLDGTAIVYVNSSVAALNALRGAQFDVDPERAPDRETLRRYFSSANAQVSRVTLSRRSNRRFVHIRIDVADVSKLNEAPPFACRRRRRRLPRAPHRRSSGARRVRPRPARTG